MNPEQAGQGLPIPQRIFEGMTVYDREGAVVGTVQVVYFGGASEEAIERVLKDETPGAATSEKDESHSDANEVPAEFRAQMMRQGYVLVTGSELTGTKRYLTAEQIDGVFSEEIEGVVKDAVRLRVSRSELLNS